MTAEPFRTLLWHPLTPYLILMALLFMAFLRHLGVPRRALLTAVAIASVPLLITAGILTTRQFRESARQAAFGETASRMCILADIFADFCQEHSDRVHPVAGSEEVTADGFVDYYLAHTGPHSRRLDHHVDQFLGFNNVPVRFYLDQNHDGVVFTPEGSTHAEDVVVACERTYACSDRARREQERREREAARAGYSTASTF